MDSQFIWLIEGNRDTFTELLSKFDLPTIIVNISEFRFCTSIYTMKLLPLLPLLATAKIHTKQISMPFSDDASITILSPEPQNEARRLEHSSHGLRQTQATKQCDESQALWSLSLTTDNNPSETKWNLKQVSTNELMIEGPPSNQNYEASTAYDGQICILRGQKYVFRITDSGGDGMCCGNGHLGGFTMSVDGKVFVDRAQRDEDWSKKSFLFHVGSLTETAKPTVRPTKRPTPKPTVWDVPTVPDLSDPPVVEEVLMLTPQPVESEVVTPAPTVAAVETDSPTAEPEEGVAVSFVLMGDGKTYWWLVYLILANLPGSATCTLILSFSFSYHSPLLHQPQILSQ